MSPPPPAFPFSFPPPSPSIIKWPVIFHANREVTPSVESAPPSVAPAAAAAAAVVSASGSGAPRRAAASTAAPRAVVDTTVSGRDGVWQQVVFFPLIVVVKMCPRGGLELAFDYIVIHRPFF